MLTIQGVQCFNFEHDLLKTQKISEIIRFKCYVFIHYRQCNLSTIRNALRIELLSQGFRIDTLKKSTAKLTVYLNGSANDLICPRIPGQ